MDKIIYWNEHETILFAVEELRRLMRKAGYSTTIHTYKIFEKNDGNSKINLILTNDYNSQSPDKEPIIIQDDGFAIVHSGLDTWIIGNKPRGVLYGVYAYVRKQFGYQFINLGEELITENATNIVKDTYRHDPLFTRRGNVIETINDPEYINSLIDWGVKNGQNEYFFTFFLWDDIKKYIAPELRKRDVHVTLGGHSLSYLLAEIQADTSVERLEQDEKLKFFAENISLQDKVIQKIVDICLEEQVISRISLWPEDIGIDEKNATGFIATYIRFTEKLKSALKAEKLHVEVEHIVYNAGLSWDMLEREEGTVASDTVDVLYAYWGRDYSTSIESSEQRQERAYESLVDWNKQTIDKGRSLTIFEYYSDHFMLSELFPPLLARIKQDLTDYQKLNIKGILNLIVPLHKKGIFSEIDAAYPWKWIHHLNNYVYARLSWGEDYQDIITEYFSQFGEKQAEFIDKVSQLEKLVSKHSKWNAPLFPARVVDPEKVVESKKDSNVPSYLKEINELISSWDLSEVEQLLALQTADNFKSFTSKEMTLIYFYYLKKVAELYGEAWVFNIV